MHVGTNMVCNHNIISCSANFSSSYYGKSQHNTLESSA